MVDKKLSRIEQLSGLYRFSRWLKKRIQYRLEGRRYILEYGDFSSISDFIRFINLAVPRAGRKGWFKKLVESTLAEQPPEKQTQIRVVPLNAPVKSKTNTVMPYHLIDEVIDQAGFRIILNQCLCRKAMDCELGLVDFGCIFLGEGARYLMQGHDLPAREVSADEAKAHVRKAEELGLVPLAGYAPIEHKFFGLPGELGRRFLEICFCCTCCCLALRNARYFSPEARRNFVNVGFVAKALPTCKGCFECVSVCPTGAIKIKGDKVWVNEDDCIGCGVCQNTCPDNMIRLVEVSSFRGGLLDYFEGISIDVS